MTISGINLEVTPLSECGDALDTFKNLPYIKDKKKEHLEEFQGILDTCLDDIRRRSGTNN